MIDHILVGTDESTEAEAAMRWASQVAGVTAAELTLVEVFEAKEAERSPERARELREQMTRQVESWASRLALSSSLSVLAIEGSPEHVLPNEARRLAASAVIIGSRPFEGVTNLGLGSLAHRLAHHVDCPLIVVPNVETTMIGGSLIVAVDDSEETSVALRWSEGLARQVGARVCEVRHTGEDPVASLHARANQCGGGLIVVHARERHSLGGRLLGFVPDGLLHHPVHPVAVLPHSFRLNTVR